MCDWNGWGASASCGKEQGSAPKKQGKQAGATQLWQWQLKSSTGSPRIDAWNFPHAHVHCFAICRWGAGHAVQLRFVTATLCQTATACAGHLQGCAGPPTAIL